MKEGLLLFGKYAFAPNILQYCGPEDGKTFLEILKDYSKEKSHLKSEVAKELKQLSLQFEGAIPYLKLIALANNIKDIFDFRVVEAYWLGNNLLKKIGASNLYRHLEERFKQKVGFQEWQSMKNSLVLLDAKPFHNFHVFNIYSRIGLMRSGVRDKILATMDKCRITWGEIKEISGSNALIDYLPLEFDPLGNLNLGKKKMENFYLLENSFKKGDIVSLHWNYVCDKLTLLQKNNLIYWTNYHLEIFNNFNARHR